MSNLDQYKVSGLLSKANNQKDHVDLKHEVPLDAAICDKQWRLFVFERNKERANFKLSGPNYQIAKTTYLIGKDHRVCDITLQDSQDVSNQHAVIQFRLQKVSTKSSQPYLMDLNSREGVFINGKSIPPSRYVQLLSGDVIKLGLNNLEELVIVMNDDL